MTRTARAVLAAALTTGLAGAAVVAVADPPAPEPVEVALPTSPGLCIDLSPLRLPSICLGSLLPPGLLG
jgi:hypothetical protein